MIDITQIAEDAYSRRAAWTREVFVSALKVVQNALGRGQIDWDSGVPENWGAISDEGIVIVLVCRVLPLAVYRAEVEEMMKPIFDGMCLCGLSMDDWARVGFRIEPETLLKCFGLNQVPRGIDTNGFAVGDLWYATVA